ncbi:hypothetical protein BXY51_002202 [Actinoplanes cyaneus]|nr:hypothetical protein [Actinoplanes cyaneus]
MFNDATGTGFSQAYRPAGDEQSLLTIRTAPDHGVSLLDTAHQPPPHRPRRPRHSPSAPG